MALTWTDSPLTIDVTKIRKIHIDEIRAYLDFHVGQHTVEAGGPPSLVGNLAHPLATAVNPGFLSPAHFSVIESLIVSGNGILGIGVTAPLASTGGNSPTLSITAATSGAAGSMSAADKVKLDAMDNVPSRLTALEAKPGTGTVTSISSATPAVSIASETTTPIISIAGASSAQAGLLSANDFDKLQAIEDPLPIGTVIMWHGDYTAYSASFEINGVGKAGTAYAKWAVLDGQGGRLDMRETFPLGAGYGGRQSGSDKFNLAGTEVYGTASISIAPENVPKHRHITGQFTTTSNNDWSVITAGAPSSFTELANYTDNISGIPGDGGSSHGFYALNTGSGANQYVTWTSQKMFDAQGGEVPLNNMPPFMRLWFLIKIA